MKREFNREDHVYKSDAFEEIIKDTIRFFNGTPVIELPASNRFHGTGVYAIYYIGNNELYTPVSKRNRMEFSMPIYVGKAVPQGWRQSRVLNTAERKTYELHRRLREHSKSIIQVESLLLKDFMCRFMILDNAESNLIGTVEAALIRYYRPIWNSLIDGFGNHDPGKGRYNQAKSDWDVIHPGRSWAEKCLGEASTQQKIFEKIIKFFEKENL